MFDLIAVGELLIDFTPESAPGAPKPLYSQNPGGAPGNVLAAPPWSAGWATTPSASS